MSEVLTPDVCVIGAGSGGLSAAAGAAALGASVVLIEKGHMGGDCLNTGCVPSKALLAAAKHVALQQKAARFGLHAPAPTVDWPQVQAHVRSVIRAIAPNDSAARFTGLGVQVIRDAATFADARTVHAGAHSIKARAFILATGSAPVIPPITGLKDTPYHTHETIFDIEALPQHLIIIGGGAIDVEMAQAFRRLGSAVTIIESATPLAREERECARIVLECLQQEGVTIHDNTHVLRTHGTQGAIHVVIANAHGEVSLQGTHLLIAAGRKGRLDGLNLEAAGIVCDNLGIKLDARLRTTNTRVYAIGDVAGGAQFTHNANWQAGCVLRHALFALPARADAAVMPHAIYTDPEFAHVGLQEQEARAQYGRIHILRWPYHENDRAQTERTTQGHIKIITTRRGKILGATLVGAHAGEIISMWTLAIRQRLHIWHVANMIMPYPTMSEVGRRAAISFFAARVRSVWIGRMMRIVRWFR